jgi:hypothetical protein
MATVIKDDYNNDWLDALIRTKQLQQQERYQAIAEQQQARKWGNVEQSVEAMNRQRGVGFLDRLIGDKVADTGFGKLFGFKKPTTAEDFGVRAPGSGLFKPKTAELRDVPQGPSASGKRVAQAAADAEMRRQGGYSTKGVTDESTPVVDMQREAFQKTKGREPATRADYAAVKQEKTDRAYNENAQSRADAYNASIPRDDTITEKGYLRGDTYQEQLDNLARRWNNVPSNQREALRSEFQRTEALLNDRWGRGGKYKSMFGGGGTGKMKSYTVKDAEGKPLAPIDASSAEQAVKAYKQRNKITDDRVLVADEVGKSEAGSELEYKREKDKEVMLSNYGKAKTDKQRAAIKAAFESQYGETIVRTDSRLNPFDETRYEVQSLGGNDTRRIAGKQGPSQATAKPITDDIARKILKEAGNDPQKAEQIAKDRGYTIE